MTDAGADDAFARSLRGFGPIGILSIVVILLAGNDWILPLGALLALVWARQSHTPLSELGFVPPKSWIATVAIGVVAGVLLKFLLKAVVMPLLGADPVNQSYRYLTGNAAALPGMIWTVVVGAGFGEETVFRGFLFERLGKILGKTSAAKALIVVIVAALFAAAHYAGQGWWGVEQAAITGLVFGAMYAATGQLWLVICAHAAFDLTALGMIYLDLEYTIAHLIFK
jgi:membrane protease YdiL (CAAX protease family)